MTRTRALVAVAGLLGALAVGRPAAGDERRHTVAPGESLSAIAKRYYGDFAHADLLQRFNGRSGANLRPGETLRIPSSPVHRVRAGDTGSALAARYLGLTSAWPAIAELNGAVPEAPLRVDQELVMPVVLRHPLARGESLAALAARHYADPSRARLLMAFNRIADPRDLSVGQVVEIPLLAPRLVDRAPETPAPPVVVAAPAPAPAVTVPAPAPEPAPPAGPPAWFTEGLAEANRAYRAGDYDAARERIEKLADRVDTVPDPEDRGRLWRLAAFVHVAFDNDEAACAAFRSLAAERGAIELDPNLVSPKIRESLGACETARP